VLIQNEQMPPEFKADFRLEPQAYGGYSEDSNLKSNDANRVKDAFLDAIWPGSS
jgi:hypothetical protein